MRHPVACRHTQLSLVTIAALGAAPAGSLIRGLLSHDQRFRLGTDEPRALAGPLPRALRSE
jgi:hypothetical protein